MLVLLLIARDAPQAHGALGGLDELIAIVFAALILAATYFLNRGKPKK